MEYSRYLVDIIDVYSYLPLEMCIAAQRVVLVALLRVSLTFAQESFRLY